MSNIMNRRDFLAGTAVAAAALVMPSIAEAGPVNEVPIIANKAALQQAAKRTVSGAATDAATGAATGAAQAQVQQRTGGFGGLIRKIPVVGDKVDNTLNSGLDKAATAFSDTGKGLKVLIEEAVKAAQAAGKTPVLYVGPADSPAKATLKANLEKSSLNSTLITIDGASDRDLAAAVANVFKEHEGLGSPLAQIYGATDSKTPVLTQNAFAVTPDVLKNIPAAPAGAAPGAAPAAPAQRPPDGERAPGRQP